MFEFDGIDEGDPRPRGDPFLAAMLLPAMALGEDIEVEAPVSPMLVASLQRIMDIYVAWAPLVHGRPTLTETLGRPSVRATVQPACTHGDRTALFFSGGVDSWFSLEKYTRSAAPRDGLDLVFVRGFDIPLGLEADDLSLAASRAAAEAADATGTRLVTVRTNIREFAERVVAWPLYHGGALASVALCLPDRWSQCLIGSSDPYEWLEPWGSHPILDPLWSTETLRVVHDGCEARRTQKIRTISASALALSSLRVCWENRNGDFNCCQCEKCLRTMVVFEALGVLERAATFPKPLDLKRLRGAQTVDEYQWERDIQSFLLIDGSKELRDRVNGALTYNRRRRRVGAAARRVLGPQLTARILGAARSQSR